MDINSAMYCIRREMGEGCDCTECNEAKGSKYCKEHALSLALTALAETREREENKPLTISELSDMVGEPVWCSVDKRWFIVAGVCSNGDVAFEHFGTTTYSEVFYKYKKLPDALDNTDGDRLVKLLNEFAEKHSFVVTEDKDDYYDFIDCHLDTDVFVEDLYELIGNIYGAK